jgi:pSer/pThr/pTyr-binding forkhead associated (FHA) protein
VRIRSETVSRRHAELRRDGAGWILADLGSSNGTFANGRRVRSMPIQGAVEVRLGSPAAGVLVKICIDS